MWGLKVNVFEVARRLLGKKLLNPAEVVAKRFLQIFHDHGIPTAQIPRLISKITLEKIQSTDTLVAALSNEILDEAADLFGVRRSWLDGDGDQIYDCYHCYKDPRRFFEDIKSLQIDTFDWPLAAFCSVSTLDCKSVREQIIVPVFREKCAKLGEQTIYRYRIYDDGWNWGYWKTRIQMKAMIRIWDKQFKAPVPVFRVSRKNLEGLLSGNLVPHACYQRITRLMGFNLEDFSLFPHESRVSKEPEELAEVLEYIKAHKLEES